MRRILEHVLSSNEVVKTGTDVYYDDIVVNNDKTPTDRLIMVLNRFGLESKPPVAIDGGLVLRHAVKTEANGMLRWQRD
mgnify:CR=1 FL=1